MFHNRFPKDTHVILPTSPWWYGLIVLYGQQNHDWEYYPTDIDWWTVHFYALNIQN